MKNSVLIGTAALLCLANTAAQADVVHADATIINSNLCVGSQCADGETFGGFDTIKLDGAGIGILFNDTGGTSDNDWRIQANATNEDSFFITDVTGGTSPFKIRGAAPNNSLFVAADGKIGMGTSIPQAELHITAEINEALRIDRPNVGDGTYGFDIGIGSGGDLRFKSLVNNLTPFSVKRDAPHNSLVVSRTQVFVVSDLDVSNGDLFVDVNANRVGMGTETPEGKLHTKGDGHQIVYFESNDANAVQVRFRSDSENRRFLATNNSDEVKTQMQFKDNSIVFLGETVAQEWLNVSAAGITTAGPTCNPGPCDATFDPTAFEVPSIEDHAAYMWENQHLWAVGPTTSDQPFNLTQKAGGMLHELEVAHIYIEQLHDQIKEQVTQSARQQAQNNARIAALQVQNSAHATQMSDLLERLARLEAPED